MQPACADALPSTPHRPGWPSYFGASLGEEAESEHPSWNVAPTDEVLGVRDRPHATGARPNAP